MNSNVNFAKSLAASLPAQSPTAAESAAAVVAVAEAEAEAAKTQTNLDELFLREQDAEIQLLESVKRFLGSKLKLDKDYALSLSALIGQQRSDKADSPAALSSGCPTLLRTWQSVLDDLRSLAKRIARNCETIETSVLQAIAALSSEKKNVRKMYTSEFSAFHQQLLNLCDNVGRKRADYKKCLDDYKFTRSRFEDFFIKCGRSGRKVDDFRDKCQKACRKLHLTHNEYVLLLSEACEYEKHYKTVLVPHLLEVQASIRNSFLSKWQQLFKDIIVSLNMNVANSEMCPQKLLTSIDSMATDEQADSEEKFATGSIFEFDESLVDDVCGKLLPNKLAVDNLTIEALRQKLSRSEQAAREAHDKLQFLNENRAPASGKGAIGPSGADCQSKLNALGEFGQLKMQEKKCSQLCELIRSALNELGCEEVPPGYDNLLRTKSSADACTVPPSCGPSPRPASSSATPPPAQPRTHLSGLSSVQGAGAGTGTGAAQLALPSTAASPSSSRKSAQARTAAAAAVAAAAASSPSHRPANAKPREDSSTSALCAKEARLLVDEDWFHGVLPREEVVRLLRADGDFLVRETVRNDECQVVLSVCWQGHKHFIVQTSADGHYRFEGPSFATVRELIRHQFVSQAAVTSRSGAVLKKPIVREQWELNNSDVVLIEKIGKGNFGDVYKARLQVPRYSSLAGGGEASATIGPEEKLVAVKTCRLTLPDDHRKKFLQEGRLLKQYDHPNIVKLIGICVQKQPVMIVMELVGGGSLLNFLRNESLALGERQLLAMCRDTASGMRYLESKNCIHRDLAARNCLIGSENIVKISDFGMSREQEEYTVSDGLKQIPIKWTAPEALNFGRYTSLCDVWSYGVLVWEIFSRGETPYSGMSNSKAREKIDDGYRLPAPAGTRDEIYSLMLRCWQYEADARPHFAEIFQIVDSLHSLHSSLSDC